MANRGQILKDPRSGAAAGATRATRPAPDQRSRDELADARARQRRRTGALPASPGDRPNAIDRKRRPRPAPAAAAPGPASSAPAAAASPSASGETPAPSSSSPASSRSFGTDGAGAFLALVLYPLAINFLQGGPAQMFGWIKAKWVNQPYTRSAPASAAARGAAFAAARRGQQGPALALARKGR